MGFKKGYAPWNKGLRGKDTSFYGKTHSEGTKKKISEAKKGKRCSPNTEFKKGHKQSKEIREKISEYNRNNGNSGMFKKGQVPKIKFEIGNIPWNKGKTLSKKHIDNLSVSHKGQVSWSKGKSLDYMKGEKNWNWNGGSSDKGYPDDWTEKLRETVRIRDNYMCQKCGIYQDEQRYKLSVHHIDFDKTNSDLNNLITYCIKCHISLHAENNVDSRGDGSLQQIQDEE